MRVRVNVMRRRNVLTRLQGRQVHPHEKGPLEKGHGKTSRQERWFILLAGEF